MQKPQMTIGFVWYRPLASFGEPAAPGQGDLTIDPESPDIHWLRLVRALGFVPGKPAPGARTGLRSSPRGANRTLAHRTWFGFVRGTGRARRRGPHNRSRNPKSPLGSFGTGDWVRSGKRPRRRSRAAQSIQTAQITIGFLGAGGWLVRGTGCAGGTRVLSSTQSPQITIGFVRRRRRHSRHGSVRARRGWDVRVVKERGAQRPLIRDHRALRVDPPAGRTGFRRAPGRPSRGDPARDENEAPREP
jgi:hypothetical protein